MSPISCFYIKSESTIGQSRLPLSFKINEKDKKRLLFLSIFGGREAEGEMTDGKENKLCILVPTDTIATL